jgi:hypothetical protein
VSEAAFRASPRSIATTLLISMVLAVVGLLVFVLPAEYGIDPIGAGDVLGLTGMSGYSVNALTTEDEDYRTDSIEFPLAPFESIEYKYALQQGQALIYDWEADGEVIFDFHSEEEGRDPEDAVSFSVGRATRQRGTYVAPYSGIHGWFWENRGDTDVVVKLNTTGFFTASKTFSAAGEYKREF